MATIQQGHDRIGSIKLLNASTIDAEETSFGAENLNEQPPPSVDVRIASPNLLCDSNTVNSSRDALGELGTDAVGDGSTVYPSNIYAPQAHAFYYGGYQNTTGEWEEYPHYLNAEGMEVGSNGIYNENPSVMFHTSYGYSPQMPYGPYSPATTPLPSAGGDGQLYSTQHFQFGAPYYQQPAPPSMSYLTSPTPMSQPDLTMPVGQQGPFLADASNSNGMLLGQGPSYPLPYGSFGGGSFAGNYANPSFHDLRQGFDGVGSGGLWADWKSPDAVRSLTPLSSPAASAQPVGAFRSFGQSITPLASGMASQQERAFHDFGSSVRSYDRGCSHGGMYHQGRNFGGSISSLEMNGQAWIAIDKGRRRGKGNASLCNCNGMLDFLNEQNRGPRAIKPKNPATEWNSSLDSKNDKPTARADHELYNRPDFVTEYKDAKFFIIKSYSEDNVHKSIKYGVWASTANGNRKLDSAYHEAKEKGQSCPVFLFFSVNASAQFCGLAEMIGPVDFDKSVDYWQQDKWSGQFLVKWHMVKDVPNSLFRHIILENNDNKPVTNSRDTQEVKLEQGLEMLDLFKKHESSVSILDDFDFYEERQEAMQERKARQQQQHQQQHQSKLTKAVPAAVGDEQWNPAPTSGEFINQMSENFANAVRLQETSNEVLPTEKSSSVITAPKRGDLTESAVAAETQSSD